MLIMKELFNDRVCIITGGANGIGRAAAEAFAAGGAKVVIADLDGEAAQQAVDSIVQSGGQAIAVIGDITGADFPETLIQRTVDEFGPSIDILVNNAGFIWDGALHKMTDQQWQTLLDVHITAPFRIVRAATPYIRGAAEKEIKENGKARCRKIINISSVAGQDGGRGQINYSSAKSAMFGFTKALAREWGRFNVCVNCITFGIIATPRVQADLEASSIIPETTKQVYTALCPLGRFGTVEDAAGAILLLASPWADYISGQVLRVSGGY